MPESGRKRGRERIYDAERTRENILNAAETLFAQHGFAGTSVEAIAVLANHTKSLIFQYFGDKLNLYTEVLRRAHREANELRARAFAPLFEQAKSPLEASQFRAFLETAIGGLFDHLVEHPRLMRILLWEMAEGWQTYAKISTHLPTDKVEQLEHIFRQAQLAGILRSDYSPIIQLMQALQTCLSYLASLPLYQTFLPEIEAEVAPSSLAQGREYLIASVVAGIVIDSPTAS
ncbi:TetR/AcrR family transcriptional regulator [Ktedonospora formicarum]|uniref:TetR family transcriptional regulator n=1 Tax=Ktedonospora formicarum TaxID=2778364 RepID=A0A8J3I4J5_9CHLR|nr:TetR/AcrR family transcriptional regulator [Ktedonospora formicarum]GHO46057.1 TetR family transcriptional regulator [Ktedonospora formicarum]